MYAYACYLDCIKTLLSLGEDSSLLLEGLRGIASPSASSYVVILTHRGKAKFR